MMSKTNLFGCTVAVALSLLFFSCFNNNELLTSIPKDAKFVVSIKPLDLWQKAGNDFADSKFIHKMLADTKENNRGLAKFYKQLLEKPTAIGINWLKPTFFFDMEEVRGQDFFVMLAPLQDATAFENTFEDLKDHLSSVEIDESEQDGIHLVSFYQSYGSPRYSALGWTKDKLIFVQPTAKNNSGVNSPEDLTDLLADLFKLKKERSILANEGFAHFSDSRHDLNFWIPLEQWEESDEWHRLQQTLDISLEDCYAFGGLSFLDGEIVLSTDAKLNPQLQKECDKYLTDQKVDAKLLDALTEDPVCLFSAVFSPNQIEDFLKEKDLWEAADEKVQANFGVDLEALFHSATGDFICAFNGMEKKEVSRSRYNSYYGEYTNYSDKVELPQFTLLSSLKSDKAINSLLEEIADEQNGGYYEYSDGNFPIFLSTKSNTFQLTTDKDLVREKHKPLTDLRLRKAITDNQCFVYFDIKQSFQYFDNPSTYFLKSENELAWRQFLLKNFTSLEFKANGNQAIFSARCKAEEENSISFMLSRLKDLGR